MGDCSLYWPKYEEICPSVWWRVRIRFSQQWARLCFKSFEEFKMSHVRIGFRLNRPIFKHCVFNKSISRPLRNYVLEVRIFPSILVQRVSRPVRELIRVDSWITTSLFSPNRDNGQRREDGWKRKFWDTNSIWSVCLLEWHATYGDVVYNNILSLEHRHMQIPSSNLSNKIFCSLFTQRWSLK